MRFAPLLVLGLLACSGSSPSEAPAPQPRERAKKALALPAPSGALALTVSAGGEPLAGVAVWVDESAEKAKPAATTLELGAKGLDQSLLVLPGGSAVSVHNQGTTPRSVRMVAVDAPADAPALASRALPAGGMAGMALPASGMVDIGCEGEPCGQARVVLAPVGGVSDGAGKVKLVGLAVAPARVHAWHPERGRLDQTLEVKQDQESSFELQMP